ncbi:hypothetical protein O181_000926 [Austropuccinia psidii MF-1]|uniref:BZIP domain-containing protein n=1 Tax=Austropuccinia psidii MF-1 TaxID=1389203 RepID=A0A9Q3BA02_9BASI|nr:hypothetical protein [Austropuccinia psidii MF-1]
MCHTNQDPSSLSWNPFDAAYQDHLSTPLSHLKFTTPLENSFQSCASELPHQLQSTDRLVGSSPHCSQPVICSSIVNLGQTRTSTHSRNLPSPDPLRFPQVLAPHQATILKDSVHQIFNLTQPQPIHTHSWPSFGSQSSFELTQPEANCPIGPETNFTVAPNEYESDSFRETSLGYNEALSTAKVDERNLAINISPKFKRLTRILDWRAQTKEHNQAQEEPPTQDPSQSLSMPCWVSDLEEENPRPWKRKITDKRREQNRAHQRAFRERRNICLKQKELEICDLKEELKQCRELLRAQSNIIGKLLAHFGLSEHFQPESSSSCPFDFDHLKNPPASSFLSYQAEPWNDSKPQSNSTFSPMLSNSLDHFEILNANFSAQP